MVDDQTAAGGPSDEARKWAMFCHLAALVGLLGNGIGFLLGPLAVWLLKKEEDPFVDENGKEAVNFQITVFIALAVSAVLVLVVIGILMLIVIGLLAVILPVVAGIKARDGEVYRYPMTIRFIK